MDAYTLSMTEKFSEMLDDRIDHDWAIWQGEKKGNTGQTTKIIMTIQGRVKKSFHTYRKLRDGIRSLDHLDRAIKTAGENNAYQLYAYTTDIVQKALERKAKDVDETDVAVLYTAPPKPIKTTKTLISSSEGGITTPFQSTIDAYKNSGTVMALNEPYLIDDMVVMYPGKSEIDELIALSGKNLDIEFTTNKTHDYVIIYSGFRKGLDRPGGIIGVGILPNKYSIHGAVHRIKQLQVQQKMAFSPAEEKSFSNLRKLSRYFS